MTLDGALEIHNDVLNKINSATKVSDIPAIGEGDFEERLRMFFKDYLVSADGIKELAKNVMEDKDESEIQLALMNACKSLNLDDTENLSLFESVNEKLSSDPVLMYLKEELKAREAKIEELIGKNYEDIKVFTVPTHEGEFEGKRFYNCYINKVDNLSLDILSVKTSSGNYPAEEVDTSAGSSNMETSNDVSSESGEMDLSSYSVASNDSTDGMDLSSYSNTTETNTDTEKTNVETDLSSFGESNITNESDSVEEAETEDTISNDIVSSSETISNISSNNNTYENSEGSKSLLEIQEMINELIKDDNIKEAEFQKAKAEYMEYKKEFKQRLQELNMQIAEMISDADKSLGN